MLFSHYGDYGDVIYALSAIRDLCDECRESARLYLYPDEGPREIMTAQRAHALLPLLRAQNYLMKSDWRPSPIGVRLDMALRKFAEPKFNLADRVNHYLGIPHSDRSRPWLWADPIRAAHVVISRSSRHRPASFPWDRIVESVGRNAVFIGLEEEYFAFCQEVAPSVRFMPTANLLEAARIIAGCDLFIGNQSAPRAIAEGLKVPVVVEQSEKLPDTHWERPEAWYGSDASFWCPALGSRP